MDEKDRSILDVLRHTGRASLKEISHRTGLRPSTVHARVKHLEQDGTIEHFTVKLDNKKVGENFIVFLFVKTTGHLDVSNNHIKEVFGVTGEHDLLLKLKFSGIEEFNEFLLTFREQEVVQDTLTMVATATVKEEL
ncbi:MAG: Lrp/AsnC family transcriptional regulator [Candidatus Woesearchaeota archaeon]|nr:Lrp/AsnC family transcriptional regulator [Candidatus Woesearchaeota archaeon]